MLRLYVYKWTSLLKEMQKMKNSHGKWVLEHYAGICIQYHIQSSKEEITHRLKTAINNFLTVGYGT